MQRSTYLFGLSFLAGLAASTIACVTAPADEGVESQESAIVGGVEAQPNAWPGTVAVYFGTMQGCGGALVADQWVLTAGHCIDSPSQLNGGVTKVVIGRHRLSSSDGESINVKRAYRHPGFNGSTLDNDLALLELASKSSAPRVKLIDAAQNASVVVEGAGATVVGWGNTSAYGGSTDVLRQVDVPVIGNATCKTYSQYENVTSNQFCAGYPNGGKDSCQGDSGGPIFMLLGGAKVQVGLVSWGIGCAGPRAPGVYTRIGNYLAWLSQTSGGAIGAGGGTDAGTGTDSGSGADAGSGTDAGGSFAPFSASGSVAKDGEKSYSFSAPAGTYSVVMSGTNDADLYVKKNAAATSKQWDCRPYENGSAEQCEVALDAPGTIYVMVRGFAAQSDFTVKGERL